jgi:hypothetical protein
VDRQRVLGFPSSKVSVLLLLWLSLERPARNWPAVLRAVIPMATKFAFPRLGLHTHTPSLLSFNSFN